MPPFSCRPRIASLAQFLGAGLTRVGKRASLPSFYSSILLKLSIEQLDYFIFILLQQHQETECPAYPVVCDKCSKDGIPRGKVRKQVFFSKLRLNARAKPSFWNFHDIKVALF